MSLIAYERWGNAAGAPTADHRQIIERATEICRALAAQGYDITLRQLYYQFVRRNWISNEQKSYKRLGDIIGQARMAGLFDWRYLIDRTRNLAGQVHWDSVEEIIETTAPAYVVDKWEGAPRRVEVWVEKEALVGVIGNAARRLDVDWFACRGYVSLSEMWNAAQRLGRYVRNGQAVTILHLGDHDPSGLDMTRDITDRLQTFCDTDAHGRWFCSDEHEDGLPKLEVRRIALNMDQIEQYQPPPNPAKITDTRAAAYIEMYGPESWELDALDPPVIEALITEHISAVRDETVWQDQVDEQERGQRLLRRVAERWRELADQLDDEEE